MSASGTVFSADDGRIRWLLTEGNPAVRCRTSRELLGLECDPAPSLTWIEGFLPEDWHAARGIWYVYYLSALSECGIMASDLPEEWFCQARSRLRDFDCGCEAFMLLQVMVQMGLGQCPEAERALELAAEGQLPDGGFLCQRRRSKLDYTPKSCYKASYHALRLCAGCRKAGISAPIADRLIPYFLDRNLLFRRDDPEKPVLNEREGWRNVDAFFPFEVMRFGIQNILETVSALGYGNHPAAARAWELLRAQTDGEGRVILSGTMTKSWLPKEKVGRPSQWATFYALLAEKERAGNSFA